MARDRAISELAGVEFTGSLNQAFYTYGQNLQGLGRRLAFELEMGASDSEAMISRLHGHPLLFGLDVKVRARYVAKRLKRAHELAEGLTREGQKFHDDYVRHFVNRVR